MTDLLEYIKKMQEMYGEDVITTADKINRPEPKKEIQEIEAINEFVRRNPRADGGRIGFKKGKDVMPVRMTVEELHNFLGLEKSKGNSPFNKIYRNLDSDAYLALNPGKVAKDATGTLWRFDKPTPAQVEEIMKIHVGSGGAQSGKIREATAKAVRKLYKDKVFMNFLEKYKKGDKIPTQVIKKIFSADGAYSPHIASTLGRILEGQLELEGIKVNKKLGAKIQQGMEYSTKGKGIRGAWHTAAYTYARNQLNFLDPSKSFTSYQNDIKKLLKELNLPNFSPDEIQAIRTGHTGGTNPWSVFSQILTDKQNKFKGSRFDSETAKKQIRLNDAIKKHGINSSQVSDIIQEQDEFVKSFKNQNPEFKKKNLTRFDLRSPKQVLGANVYNELPSRIKNALDADFAKNKYSINVGKGALTQKQLITNLLNIKSGDNAATIASKIKKAPIPNKFKALLLPIVATGGAVTGADFLKKSGILFDKKFEPTASAGDAPLVEKGLSTGEKAAIAAGTFAGVGTKKGRNILGKGFKTLGTPITGPLYAGYNIYDKMKSGSSFADAAFDPITGLELSFPALFKENVSKITKNPLAKKILEAKFIPGSRFIPGIGTAITLGSLAKDSAEAIGEESKRIDAIQDSDTKALEMENLIKSIKGYYASGGRAGYMGGGITEIRKPSAIPPTGGPMSQGLRSLYNNGKKL